MEQIEGEGPGEIAIPRPQRHEGLLQPARGDRRDDQEGWIRTGDLATQDEEGYYYIVDRYKDMIIRGGYNVYPRELEEVLMTPPGCVRSRPWSASSTTRTAKRSRPTSSRTAGAEVTEEEMVAWGKERSPATSTRGWWSAATSCRCGHWQDPQARAQVGGGLPGEGLLHSAAHGRGDQVGRPSRRSSSPARGCGRG